MCCWTFAFYTLFSRTVRNSVLLKWENTPSKFCDSGKQRAVTHWGLVYTCNHILYCAAADLKGVFLCCGLKTDRLSWGIRLRMYVRKCVICSSCGCVERIADYQLQCIAPKQCSVHCTQTVLTACWNKSHCYSEMLRLVNTLRHSEAFCALDKALLYAWRTETHIDTACV